MKNLISLLISCVVLISVANAQTVWQWQNPLPTGNNGFESSCFLNHSTGWMISEGTVSKTTDNGLSWNTASLADPRSGPLRSISFFNPDIGLVSGSNCAFRSTNGGRNWFLLDLGTGTDSYWPDCQMTSSMTGWVVGPKVLKTNDGGGSWITMYPLEDTFFRCVFFINSMTGWIGGDSYSIRTTNGGQNWIQVERSGVSDIFFVDAFTGWMTCSDGICKTTNSGDDWAMQNSNGVSPLCFINGNTGWASNMKTTDGGDNWFVQNNYDGLTSIYFDATLNGWRTNLGVNSLYRSSDGGDNWTNMNCGFRYDLNACFFVSESTGWVAGESGAIYSTSNGGLDWNLQQSGINSSLRSIFFTSQTEGWAGGSELFKTTNAGSTWELQTSVSEDLYSIHFSNQSVGLIGAQGKILRTSDAGINWTTVFIDEGARVNSVCFSSSNVGWAVGRDGLILRSTNEGQSWNQIYSPASASLLAVHFPSPSTGYIVGNYGPAYILKTTNAGDSWEEIFYGGNTMIDPGSVHFFDNNTGWIACNYGTVARTTDGGFNWQVFYSGTDDYLKSMSFVNEMTGWVVGTDGTILKTANAGIVPFRVELKFFIEGLYDPDVSREIKDTARVFLREGSSPFNKVDSTITVFDVNGNCNLEFYGAQPGSSYYLSIEHRNALETWSANLLQFNNTLLTLDFTINGAVAYGANQILVGNMYCFYSGDVNSDGVIDGSDLLLVENDALQFMSGYLLSDLTGDGFTDATDLVIVDNNSFSNVMVRRP